MVVEWVTQGEWSLQPSTFTSDWMPNVWLASRTWIPLSLPCPFNYWDLWYCYTLYGAYAISLIRLNENQNPRSLNKGPHAILAENTRSFNLYSTHIFNSLWESLQDIPNRNPWMLQWKRWWVEEHFLEIIGGLQGHKKVREVAKAVQTCSQLIDGLSFRLLK